MMNFLVKLIPTGFSIGSVTIKWYAVCILTGAMLAYLITRLETKKLGKDPDAITGLFVVSLIAGILGARIWYVAAQWSREFGPVFETEGMGKGLLNMVAIWQGGLAIQGGAMLGITVGLLYVHFFIKELKPFQILDYVVPSILLAQAIGRVGNFINQEVFGKCVSVETYKMFPEWFLNQFIYQNTEGSLLCDAVDQMKTPLFLYEGVINIIGFIVLFFIGYKLLTKKNILPIGVISSMYFVWYGVTRIVLEPLRDAEYQMGTDGVPYSRIMAFAWVGIGVLGIVIAFIIGAKAKSKQYAKQNLIKEVTSDAEELSGERVLTRAEVGITKYITPEKYKAHDFEGVDSDLLSDEDREKAKDLVKEDDEVVDDFIVIKGPELPEEEVVIDESKTVSTVNDDISVAEEEEEEIIEHRVVEIEEGDVPELSHINKFVEKNQEVEDSILEGYRTQYNPDVQKGIQEEENSEVTSTISDEELAKADEVPLSDDGQPLIEFKNGFGSSEYVSKKDKEESQEEEEKNVVEIEEGDVPELSKVNKFFQKDEATENSIIEGYRTQYNPDIEKNVFEEENSEVASTLDVELEEGEKVPEIGEISIDFKQMPAPERTGGTSCEPVEESPLEETNSEDEVVEESSTEEPLEEQVETEETPLEDNIEEEPIIEEELSQDEEEDEEVLNPFGKAPLQVQEDISSAYEDEEVEEQTDDSSFSWGAMGTFSKEEVEDEDEDNSSFSWTTEEKETESFDNELVPEVEETPAEEEIPEEVEEEMPTFARPEEEKVEQEVTLENNPTFEEEILDEEETEAVEETPVEENVVDESIPEIEEVEETPVEENVSEEVTPETENVEEVTAEETIEETLVEEPVESPIEDSIEEAAAPEEETPTEDSVEEPSEDEEVIEEPIEEVEETLVEEPLTEDVVTEEPTAEEPKEVLEPEVEEKKEKKLKPVRKEKKVVKKEPAEGEEKVKPKVLIKKKK